MVTTPGRCQQQEFRAELGDRMATWFAGRAEVQRMGSVQPGKIAGRAGHDTGSQCGVAPGEISAGVGGGRATRMTGQTIQLRVQGGGNCESWPKLPHRQERPAGCSVGRTGRRK
jgi:hypothetical protein